MHKNDEHENLWQYIFESKLALQRIIGQKKLPMTLLTQIEVNSGT